MPSANAKTSLGARIEMGTAPGALTAIADVITITPPKISRQTIEASDLDTIGGMEHLLSGIYDLTPVSLQMHYAMGSAADTMFMAAATSAPESALRYFRIIAKAPSGTDSIEFQGFVTEYGPEQYTIEGKQVASVTIKPTGDWA